ncbi:colicin-like bacteriocin tRNase domain-containing protein [Klebsiella pneumoniae]|uniref:colicin-like bacteriocin tRNase domain-containing protein n=1 Tax=Klebsiella pneumoniae TaxID=573 RepID=UPI00351F01DA
MSVPVVDARPTTASRGYSVCRFRSPVSAGGRAAKVFPAAKAAPKGIIAGTGDSRPAGFAAGGDSH